MLCKLLKPLLKTSFLFLKPSIFTPLVCFKFNTLSKISTSRKKLFDTLEKEFKFEQESYKAGDETVIEFIKKENFTLIDKEDDTNLELIKKVEDHTINIVFQSRTPVAPEEESEQQQKDQKNEEQQENMQQEQDYCDFTIYVTKNSDGKILAYECSSMNSELSINSVNLIQDINQHKKQSRYDRLVVGYNGPEISTLDERLQTSLQEFLKSLGINEEVIQLVEHLSLDKEQRLYMKWLKETKEFFK